MCCVLYAFSFREGAYLSDFDRLIIVEMSAWYLYTPTSTELSDCLFEIRKIAVYFLWLSLPVDYRVTDEGLLAETT